MDRLSPRTGGPRTRSIQYMSEDGVRGQVLHGHVPGPGTCLLYTAGLMTGYALSMAGGPRRALPPWEGPVLPPRPAASANRTLLLTGLVSDSSSGSS